MVLGVWESVLCALCVCCDIAGNGQCSWMALTHYMHGTYVHMYICTYIHIYIYTYICHVCQSMFACVGEVIRTKWYVRLVFHCKAISFHSSRLCSLLLCIGGLWLLWCCMHCLAQVHKDMRVYTCYCVQCQPHCEVCTGLGSVGGLCCCFVADVETVRCVW